jgi:hypothetical protein
MGLRQKNLVEILLDNGCNVNSRRLDRVRSFLSRDHSHALEQVYRRLGGQQEDYPIDAGVWDIEVDGVALELDEERHFNRYRTVTLESSIYRYSETFPWDVYREYCLLHEPTCLRSARHGGYWTSASSERQFGPAEKPGILEGRGSPRWRQRAFYDFLKDIAVLTGPFRMSRISIWDTVSIDDKVVLLNDCLLVKRFESGPGIIDLIAERAWGG